MFANLNNCNNRITNPKENPSSTEDPESEYYDESDISSEKIWKGKYARRAYDYRPTGYIPTDLPKRDVRPRRAKGATERVLTPPGFYDWGWDSKDRSWTYSGDLDVPDWAFDRSDSFVINDLPKEDRAYRGRKLPTGGRITRSRKRLAPEVLVPNIDAARGAQGYTSYRQDPKKLRRFMRDAGEIAKKRRDLLISSSSDMEDLRAVYVIDPDLKNLNKYTVPELKAIARGNNLTVSGTKKQLMRRIRKHFKGSKVAYERL